MKYFPALVNRFTKSQPELQGYSLDALGSGPFPVSHVAHSAPDSGYEIGERSLLPENPKLLGPDLAKVVVGVYGGRQHQQKRGDADGKLGLEEEHYQHHKTRDESSDPPANVPQEVDLEGGGGDAARELGVLLVELILDFPEYLLLSVG